MTQPYNLTNACWAFFGTPEFAKIILEKLISKGIIPTVVICNPDKPVGRKKAVTPCPVKQSILEQAESVQEKITLFQPKRLSHTLSEFPKHSYDFFLVAAYGQIIPESLLSVPKYGTIGVHPSLLPAYRGASPIQTALLEGASQTGVSLFLINKDVDHGPVLVKRALEDYHIDSLNFQTLHDILANESVNLICETIPHYLDSTLTPIPQDHTKATFTKKFTTEDGFISEELLRAAELGEGNAALHVDRIVRALSKEPGVFMMYNNVRTKILETTIKDGKLKLVQIQKAGKMPLTLTI